MNNTLLAVVSGSTAASTSVPYLLIKRLGIPISHGYILYLKEEVSQRNLPIVENHLRIIASRCGSNDFHLESFGFEQERILEHFGTAVRDLLDNEKRKESNVYIDATCGRKYISNLLVKVALEFVPPVKDILYCYLTDRRYKGYPCARVPVPYCKLFSILHEKAVSNI